MRRVLSLDGAWRIAYFEDGEGEGRGAFREGYPAKDWLAAEVPGDVHLDLTRAGRASDPFFGKNSEGVRWVEEKEWWYRREFEVPDDFRGDREELVFEGLDCYATVWLNGEEIGKHANALIPCSFDVTGKIRRGQRNVIAVRLSSPVRTVAGRRDPNVPEGLPHRERVFSRKAQVSYGWDFAPRLVTIGIWRGVTLRAYSGVVIEDVFIRPRTVRKDEAWVDLEVRLRSYLRVAREVTVDVVAGCGESRARRSLSLVVKPGANALSLGLRLANAKLWWPWNVGSPNLYDLRLRVLSGEEVLDEYQTRFGVREVKLILKEDGGNVFNFIINGKRVFARGANWVPADAFPSRVTAERYRKLLEMARRSNMNMLRVWGGGIYESDVFYDLCDRLGIMVWQEFMFACAPYPQNERFLRGVEEEARAVVRRLRNHPSIVIWCGDNEVDWSYTWWGRSDWAQNRINRAVLKNVVEELDPTRPYMPSSPFSPDPAADPNSPDQGDRHNWDVWHGKQPYRAYARDRARFCSEFGMQASPAAETMREVIPPEQWSWPPGDSWAHHNLDLQKLSPYMEEFGGAQCVEDFIRLSQLTQATVLKFAIEHFRRSKFACGGCMFWQFNEPWPTVCWSVVDYFGRPKMGYYYVKRAYSNVLVSLKEEGEGRLSLWIVNDGLEGVEGDLIVERRDFAGRRIWSDRRRVRVPPNSVLKAADVRIPEMPLASMRTEYFSARLAKGSQVISENSHFLVRERDLVLPEARLTVRARVDRSDGGDVLYKVEVGSDSYARVVKVDLGVDAQYSDNYFDVPANESREILVRVRRGVPVSRVTVKAHNSAESSCDLAPMGPLRPG